MVVMPFWKRKEKREEMAAVKEAVSAPPPPEPEMAIKPPKIELGKPPERPRFAPLFIKIDRYKEVLNNIERLKALLLNVRDIITIMHQIEKIRTDSYNLMQRNLQDIAKGVGVLDTEFVRPKGFGVEETIRVPLDVEKVEDYVGDLQRELEGLRSRLEDIEK